MNIHANDGISQSGQDALADFGFTLTTTNVAQEQLVNYINENNIAGILVRSATTVRKELIDACPGLKLIGRGGVGMDNIDVAYAREKGLHVINTPAASSSSVAELVFARDTPKNPTHKQILKEIHKYLENNGGGGSKASQ
jgi:D-3-phosphoglycerate dehydrogenase